MYSLKRVPIECIPEIFPNDTVNRDIIKGSRIFLVEKDPYYNGYLVFNGEIWYARISFYTHNKVILRYGIVKDLPYNGKNNECLDILLANERVITLKFSIFDEYYKNMGLPELSNVIKMLYYTLNI